MKLKNILLPVVLGGSFVFLSCGEKKDPAEKPTDTGEKDAKTALSATAEKAKDGAKEVAKVVTSTAEKIAPAPNVGIADLSKNAGFAAHIAKDTEGYLSITKLWDSYERLQKTEIGKFILKTLNEQGVDPKEVEQDPAFQIFKAVAGEELFLAFGDTSGEQGVHLTTLSRSSNYHQMKMLVEMAAAALQGKDPSGAAMQGSAMAMFSGILKDPKGGLDVLEKAEMPPLTIGFKVSDAEMREQIAGQIGGGLAQALEAGDEAPFFELKQEVAGVKLTGIKIDGKKAASLADEDDKQEMTQFFGGRAEVDRFFAAVAKKDLYVATGVKDDYVLIYVGGSMDGFKLAPTPADSLLSNSEMDFYKHYASKDIRFMVFGEKDAFTKLGEKNEAFGSLARGIKDGLAESDAFGDTRDVQTLLGHVAKLDGELFDMFEYERTGMVGFIEDGFKLEAHGGSNAPNIDFDSPHQYSSIGEMEDVFLFSDAASNPKFMGKLLEMLETLGEASYLMAGQVSKLDIDDGDFRQFKEGFGLFQSHFSKDLSEIWGAVSSDWADGTGNEGALVIDLKGTMPKVPGVPSSIIEKGVIPRFAYVTPITDRAAISKSWTRIEASIANLLKTASNMSGESIPMQEFAENNKDGVQSFTYPVPFVTSNAKPVIALTEKHFFLSTSPKFVSEISTGVAAGKGPARKGAYGIVNFAALNKLAKNWVALVKENADEIFEGNEFGKEDFLENVPKINQAIKALEEMEDLTWHSRREGGEVRGSIHFKMK